jgi:hypothetical protein
MQAGGQLEAHYRRLCPCYGFPPVDRVAVPEPIRDPDRAPKPSKAAKPIKHGVHAYRTHKCRCEVCRLAARAQRQKYRPKSDSLKLRLDAEPFISRLTRDGRLEAVDNGRLSQWRRGGIDLYVADRWCIRLGYHPTEIWGQEFYAGATEEAVVNG